MRVLLAPDSFKESLPAAAVAEAMADGWRRADPHAAIDLAPMADGGEGVLEAMLAGAGGVRHALMVTGPLGEPVRAAFGVLSDGCTAIIEMAQASGLHLTPPERRDPARTTTRGTGELIRAALDAGARHILVGVGGSATNDAGAGMARALGASFRDASGRELPEGGGVLASLAAIDLSGLDKRLADCKLIALCDVDNPLTGPHGASHVYGPQKGAAPDQVALLDAALDHFAEILVRQHGVELRNLPGTGAAGGLAGGIVGMLGGTISSGFAAVADRIQLPQRLSRADLVITGEGSLDGQSLRGKVPGGVLRLALAAGVPVIALAGCLGPGHRVLLDAGMIAAFALADGPITREEAMSRTRDLLVDRTEAIARLWRAARSDGHA